ncbi:hypothetical protein C0Q70_00861 [Pomacea canaliculata]|uniref:Uncharacterized protein n=1 Tax=Pomacea canaliculata TaxID=400727 RepID=A0A2T7PXX6_POMCA|nr:hypothetical protein C0Q70_00861 [Pomacea canaliculata]
MPGRVGVGVRVPGGRRGDAESAREERHHACSQEREMNTPWRHGGSLADEERLGERGVGRALTLSEVEQEGEEQQHQMQEQAVPAHLRREPRAKVSVEQKQSTSVTMTTEAGKRESTDCSVTTTS